MLPTPEPDATHSLTLRTSYSTSPRAQPPPGRSPLRTGAIRCPGTFYAPALVLQDFAYSYRVWITLIKLPYAPLRWSLTTTSIHARERLCTPLLPSVRRVSEKNSSRNCLKILSTSQPPYHQPCHCRIDERFCGGAQPLVILAHPPVLREPGEGPLHYPSAG